jgi:hypothetical protein
VVTEREREPYRQHPLRTVERLRPSRLANLGRINVRPTGAVLKYAEREFKQALQLNPSYAAAYDWFGIWLTARGRPEEGWASILKAQALDPLSLIINTDVADREPHPLAQRRPARTQGTSLPEVEVGRYDWSADNELRRLFNRHDVEVDVQ